jgi:outer membrane protein assembly factor BamB
MIKISVNKTAFPFLGLIPLSLLSILVVASAGILTSAETEEAYDSFVPSNAAWPMFKKGPGRTGRTSLTGPQTANLKWQNSSVSVNGSNPVIAADGTIYIGSEHGTLSAFKPNGTFKWSYTLSARDQVTASPALGEDGTIYIAPENGDLHALNPDGMLKWKFHLQGYGGPSASPAVARDGTIFIGARYFYAVNPNGTLRWRYDAGSDAGGPPAIGAHGTVYFPSISDQLFALEATGTLKWVFNGHGLYPIGSAPAIAKDGTIYINTNLGELQAIGADGSFKWMYESEGIVMDVPSSPAIGFDGTIYFGGGGEYAGRGGYLYALNPDGTLKWKFHAGCDQTAPSIGGDGTIYFGNNCGGTLYALSPDGALKWSYSWPLNYLRTDPAIGFRNRLYVGLLDYFVPGGLATFGP